MTTVAEYLALRLAGLGVRHLFGVPGDFSLGLVDALTAPGRLDWVGTANELDAGYAADGYARRRGLGALCTTYGVGELSAINAVAGSYAEQVPVVQITGAPPSSSRGAVLHHTLGDGDPGRTLRLYREVTACAVELEPGSAAKQIDEALQAALDRLRPVYLSVPADVVDAPVPDDDAVRLASPLRPAPSRPAALAAFSTAAAALLSGPLAAPGGGGPLLLVGHLVQRLRADDLLAALADRTGWPVVHLLSGRATLDETSPGVLGWYAGAMGDDSVRAAVDAARPLVLVGALLSDMITGFFTHRDADPARTITLDLDAATVGGRRFDGVRLADALAALAALPPSGAVAVTPPATTAPDAGPAAGTTAGTTAAPALTQRELWDTVQRWLPGDRTLVTDIGTAFLGAAGLTLPPGTAFLAQPVWSSIGWAVPAALGAALADPGRRTVLVTGEGAAQMTAAEIGLLARRAPGAVVLVLDNGGYTIERMLRTPRAAYHDVPRWDWPALAAALAPDHPPVTATVRTAGELAAALHRSDAETGRLTLLHVLLDPDDAPPLLEALATVSTRRPR